MPNTNVTVHLNEVALTFRVLRQTKKGNTLIKPADAIQKDAVATLTGKPCPKHFTILGDQEISAETVAGVLGLESV